LTEHPHKVLFAVFFGMMFVLSDEILNYDSNNYV